jgi:flavin reductase (DIM6/NTAB) family NADH-FMN oxidoreductase RutF
MEINTREIERQEKYKLLIGSVVPRPIAWVTSVSAEGVVNAAPFSYFNIACNDPMMISIAIIRKPGSELKDTSRNIQETGEFVVNMVDRFNVEAANETSIDFPPEISEVDQLGLTKLPAAAVKAPRLGEARIHFECRLHQAIALGDPPASDLIIGEVVHVHVDDELYAEGKIDIARFAPVSRLAGLFYGTLGEMFERPRPQYKKK